jgi:hypothetical protein
MRDGVIAVRILARLPKVRDYLEWYLDWYEPEHPTTISKARSEVKRFIERFDHRPIDSIRAIEVGQYKRARPLDDKEAKETVGKEIRRLKAAFGAWPSNSMTWRRCAGCIGRTQRRRHCGSLWATPGRGEARS